MVFLSCLKQWQWYYSDIQLNFNVWYCCCRNPVAFPVRSTKRETTYLQNNPKKNTLWSFPQIIIHNSKCLLWWSLHSKPFITISTNSAQNCTCLLYYIGKKQSSLLSLFCLWWWISEQHDHHNHCIWLPWLLTGWMQCQYQQQQRSAMGTYLSIYLIFVSTTSSTSVMVTV